MKPKHHAQPNSQLQQAREQRGWSQEQLAEQLGTNAFTVSRWERGTAVPRPYFRQQLAALFGLPPEALGLLPDQMPEPDSAAPSEPEPVVAPQASADRPTRPSLPLPPAPIHPLVGRETVLRQLKAHLLAGKSGALCALQGLPGVGKTALAVALAHDPDVQARFPDGVLWAGLGRQPHLLEIMSRWGTQLGMGTDQMAHLADPLSWAQALQQAIGARRLLLVIDDAWRIEDALAFRVGGPACVYLLTTRSAEVALQFADERIAPIPELSEEASLALLAQFVPQVVAAAHEQARSLVRAVGGLPLGLMLMGKHLQVHSFGRQPRRLSAALERLGQRVERLQLQVPQTPLAPHPSLPADTPLSLHASIELSVDALGPEAQAMLRALAVFPPKPASFSEEVALTVSAGAAETLDALVDAGLVESRGAGRYALHQTISDYARLQGVPPGTEQRFIAWAVDWIETCQRDLLLLEQELSLLLEALRLAMKDDFHPLLIRGSTMLASFLLGRGLYAPAEELLRQAQAAARALGDMPGLIASLYQLGRVAARRGAYEQAAAYYQEGIDLHAWGDLQLATAQWEDAKQAYTEARGLARQIKSRELEAAAWYGLARLAAAQGDLKQAYQQGQTSLQLYTAQGLYQAAEVKAWLARLPGSIAEHSNKKG